MNDLYFRIMNIKRPKLLMDAAKYRLKEQSREDHVTLTESALNYLIESEAHHEIARKYGSLDYSPSEHIRLLTTIIEQAVSLARKN